MTLQTKLINGLPVGNPDALPRRAPDGRVRDFAERGLRTLYLTSEGKGHGTPAGVYEDRSGHKWTWNAQVGWVLSNPTSRYMKACYAATLARRYDVKR